MKTVKMKDKPWTIYPFLNPDESPFPRTARIRKERFKGLEVHLDTYNFTPNEARQLANALWRAAEYAESDKVEG